jgi:Phage tail tube protein, GTA-gp10
MVNPRRGEIEGRIDGRPHTLVLTLGALAELERAFEVDDLAALGARFGEGRLSARDLTRILGAGLRAGGTSCTDEEVAAFHFEAGPAGALRLAIALLNATFGDETTTQAATQVSPRAPVNR